MEIFWSLLGILTLTVGMLYISFQRITFKPEIRIIIPEIRVVIEVAKGDMKNPLSDPLEEPMPLDIQEFCDSESEPWMRGILRDKVTAYYLEGGSWPDAFQRLQMETDV